MRLPREPLSLDTGVVHYDASVFVTTAGERRLLTPRETRLLAYLDERQGQLVSRAELLQGVFDCAPTAATRALDVSVMRLRRKIERDPKAPTHLKTGHGDGYGLFVRTTPAPLPTKPHYDVRIGSVLVDLTSGTLCADDTAWVLGPRDLIVLRALVEADGAAVSGQALWSTLAPRTTFRARVLSSAIQRLRSRLMQAAPSLHAARGSYCLRDVEHLGRDAQVERFLAGTAAHGSRILGVDDCVVYLRHDRHLVQVATASGPPPTPLVLEVGEGIVGAAAARRAPVLVQDTTRDPRYVTDGFPGRSELCVPIVRGGDVVGAIDSESRAENAYGDHHVALMESLALLLAHAPLDLAQASTRVARRAS